MEHLRDSRLLRVIFYGMLAWLWIIPPSAFSCDSQLNPRAFQIDSSNEYDLLPTGMMAIRYRPIHEEAFPHVSVHRVMMVLPGRQSSMPEAEDPQYRVVEVDGTVGWLTYLISTHALFYGVGQDALGFPERAWIDPEEDSLNGNEYLNGRSPLGN